MKTKLFSSCLVVFIIVSVLGCVRQAKDRPVPEKKPFLNGHYLYKGTCALLYDSVYVQDTITGTLAGFVVDSVMEAEIEIQTYDTIALFSIAPNALFRTLSFPWLFNFSTKGPFSYAVKASNARSYDFYFVGDSLLFYYADPYRMEAGHVGRYIGFKGIRVE